MSRTAAHAISTAAAAGEMLSVAEPFLVKNLHPTQIVCGYTRALQTALDTCKSIAKTVDLTDRAALKQLVEACVGTKFSHRWGDVLVSMAIDAVTKVRHTL
jgi:T-complex protein 1 subunit gamma